MVRILRGERQTQIGPRELVAPDYGAVGAIVSDTANQNAAILTQIRHVQEDTEISQTLSFAARRIKEEQERLATVTDPAQYEFEFGAFLDGMTEEIYENASTDRIRELLAPDVINLTEGSLLEGRKRVREITTAQGLADVDSTIQESALNASLAGNEALREFWIAKGLSRIDAGLSSGLYLEDDARKRREFLHQNVEDADFQKLMTNDLDAAQDAIQNPKMYPHMKSQRRLSWMRTVQSKIDTRTRRQIAQWEKEERDAARQVKADQQRFYIERVSPKIQNGVPVTDEAGNPVFDSNGQALMRPYTTSDLAEDSAHLGAPEYRAALAELRQPRVVADDPQTENILLNVRDGETGLDLVSKFQMNGEIGTLTARYYNGRYIAMMNSATSASQDPVLSAEKHLREALAMTETEKMMAKWTAARREAIDRQERGKREFRGWLADYEEQNQGKKPSTVEINKMVDEIKERNQTPLVTGKGEEFFRAPAPKFLPGVATSGFQLPEQRHAAMQRLLKAEGSTARQSLNLALMKLMAAQKTGEIGPERYEVELELISDWFDYLMRTKPPQKGATP
ncbi:MAG: hypothetical protein L0170_04410 [Acidobacteria bacterium]|nr:hypothetical protein [Acidobacteriota bacterium]